MILHYGNQQVKMFDKGIPDKILLSLSGGLDSAALLFILCHYFPKIEIIPYTGKNKHAPFDYECAKDIISYMRDKFPDNNIKQHEWFEFDKTDLEKITEAEERWNEDSFTDVSGLIKFIAIEKFIKKSREKYGEEILDVSGLTANPPIDEMIKYNFYHIREERRDKNTEQYEHFLYHPFIEVNKKFIADVYKQHDLWDLYELTGSCIGSADATNYFTEPCGECFWCHEKNWAFDYK